MFRHQVSVAIKLLVLVAALRIDTEIDVSIMLISVPIISLVIMEFVKIYLTTRYYTDANVREVIGERIAKN